MPQGEIRTIRAYTDFTGAFGDTTWGTGEVPLEGGWGFVSVNEGTLNTVTDESGGVLQFLTDTGDNDNVALLAGPFDPSQGPIQVEARFKVADTITAAAVFVGFTETLALNTPVMPAEFATATMTYNGSGGLLGLQWDSDATTNAWKATCGDGGAVSGSAAFGANGTNATDAMVQDEYDIARVVLHPGGGGEVWHDDEAVVIGATGLTTTDLFYAVVMLENRSAAAIEFEVDYVEATGVRDWTV